jgi:predicted transcriptional regulator
MIKKIKTKLRINQESGIFHDSRKDSRTLMKACNELIDKVNELADKINNLEKK